MTDKSTLFVGGPYPYEFYSKRKRPEQLGSRAHLYGSDNRVPIDYERYNYCKRCKLLFSKETKFCKNCGKPLRESSHRAGQMKLNSRRKG